MTELRPDRRTFLRLLLATAAAEAVDFEKLLWVPKPIITVPESAICVEFAGYTWKLSPYLPSDVIYFISGQGLRLIDSPRHMAVLANIGEP